jgi:hypothetical protein
MVPPCFDIDPIRAAGPSSRGTSMSLDVHFSRRRSANAGRLLPNIDVATKIGDIVEIARPRPYGQGAEFLREGFAIVVGHDLKAIVRHVGVRTH